MTKRLTYKIETFSEENVEEYLYSEEIMNEKDQILSALFYTGDGSVIEKFVNHYDENKQLIKTESFNGDNELIQTDAYDYSTENGQRKVVQTLTFANGTSDKYIEYYNGKYLLSSEYYKNNRLTEIEKNIYENGILSAHVILDSSGAELQKETFSYANDILTIEKFMNDDLIQKETCICEGDNILEEQIECEGIISKTKYKYDSNDNVIEESEYQEGTLISTKYSTYVDNLITEEVIEDFLHKREIVLKQIEYDLQKRKIMERDQYNFMRYVYEEIL